MSEFLVISHTHSLLPFSHRLQREGHTVKTVVVVRMFENAWRGKIPPSPRSEEKRHLLDEGFVAGLFDEAAAGDWPILIDNWELEAKLREHPGIKPERIFGTCRFEEPLPKSGLRVGGWFDGEKLQRLFGIVADRGVQFGGMGADADGALTLIRVDADDTRTILAELVDERVQELKSREFRGLVQFGLEFDTEDGFPKVAGIEAGWPFLVTHGFLSEYEGFGDLLRGGLAGDLPQKFTTVLPLSRPPWPTEKAKFRFSNELIRGLTAQQQNRVFWHDVQVDQEAGQLKTAGLDGLIGVVRGVADTSQLSAARAIEVAAKWDMPEKQYRQDAGQQVQNVLSQLEQRYEILL